LSVLCQLRHRVEVVPCGDYNAPNTLFDHAVLLPKIYGTHRTGLLTNPALATLEVKTVLAIHHRLVGYGLGRQGVDSLSLSHSLLEIRIHPLGTYLLAEATAITQIPVHVGSKAANSDPKVSNLARHLLHLRIG